MSIGDRGETGSLRAPLGVSIKAKDKHGRLPASRRVELRPRPKAGEFAFKHKQV